MSTSGGGLGGGLSNVRIQAGASAVLADVLSGITDGVAGGNGLNVAAKLEAFNAANWDRVATLSAANLLSQSGTGGLIAAGPGCWAMTVAPAAGVQASATRAAGGAAVRHIATGMLISAASILAPALTSLQVNLRNGVSGGGSIITSVELVVTAVAGQNVPPLYVPLPNLPGSPATAMTLEFSGALANLIESVTLFGFDAS